MQDSRRCSQLVNSRALMQVQQLRGRYVVVWDVSLSRSDLLRELAGREI